MIFSKTELIEALEREEVTYADRNFSGMHFIEFTFDNDIDLGFFSLSCDYRGYVKCYIENDAVTRIESTTTENEVPEDINAMHN